MLIVKRLCGFTLLLLLVTGFAHAQQTYCSPGVPYCFQIAPAVVSIVTGQSNASGTLLMNVIPENNFKGTVTFICSAGLGTDMGCTFNPTSVTTSDGFTPQTSNLTISTNGSVTGTAVENHSLHRWLALASLGLLGLFALPPVRRSRRYRWPLLVMALAAFFILPACGSSNNASNTPPGTYNITITTTYTNPPSSVVNTGPYGGLTVTVTAH